MTRWNLLCLCVVVSNENCIPLEELWFDDHLTLLGVFTLIFTIENIYIKFLDNFSKTIESL